MNCPPALIRWSRDPEFFNGSGMLESGSYGNLVMDASGNLYGTAYAGGANNDGTVFELAAVNNSTVSGRVFEDINSDNLFTTNADTGIRQCQLISRHQ